MVTSIPEIPSSFAERSEAELRRTFREEDIKRLRLILQRIGLPSWCEWSEKHMDAALDYIAGTQEMRDRWQQIWPPSKVFRIRFLALQLLTSAKPVHEAFSSLQPKPDSLTGLSEEIGRACLAYWEIGRALVRWPFGEPYPRGWKPIPLFPFLWKK